jgi:hypothetical protein
MVTTATLRGGFSFCILLLYFKLVVTKDGEHPKRRIKDVRLYCSDNAYRHLEECTCI